MSWSTATTEPVARDSIVIAEPPLHDAVEVEQRAQYEAAVEAAHILARAIGRDGDQVRVTLSGHANPGHGPRAGWADETIRVIVEAAPAPEVPSEDLPF